MFTNFSSPETRRERAAETSKLAYFGPITFQHKIVMWWAWLHLTVPVWEVYFCSWCSSSSNIDWTVKSQHLLKKYSLSVMWISVGLTAANSMTFELLVTPTLHYNSWSRMILQEWPTHWTHKSTVPSDIAVFFDYRDELTIQDGIVLWSCYSSLS